MKAFFFIFFIVLYVQSGNAQENTPIDSLKTKTIQRESNEKTIAFQKKIIQQKTDSLNVLQSSLRYFKKEQDRLKLINQNKKKAVDSLHNELTTMQGELNALREGIQSKSVLLEAQIKLLEEKEKIFARKEKYYKEAIYEYRIDSVDLIGKIETQNAILVGKTTEIDLLRDQIRQKEKDIEEKSTAMQKTEKKIERYTKKIDSLLLEIDHQKAIYSKIKERNVVQKIHIDHLKTSNADLKKQLDHCQNAGKRQKIRLTQGVAFKTFRTPKYELSPKDYQNTSVYEIHNANSGNFEVDYITGVSLKFLPLLTHKDKDANDLGFFIGFGGKDLFKNFYLGPNIKLLNAFHINVGMNIREYEVLKDGFSEGDILDNGATIPTNNEWKINWYAGLTFDFSLISNVAKKL